MKDVAMKVISQIERHCEDSGDSEPCYMVHIFSNRGVFLWDQIQHLAFDDGQKISHKRNGIDGLNAPRQSSTTENDILRWCFSGTVCDCSPCYFDKHTSGIREVMRTCSKDEWNAYEQRESQKLKLEGDALRQGFDLRQWRHKVEHQQALRL
jgi:hypothetical protein